MNIPRTARTSTGQAGLLFVRLAARRLKCLDLKVFLFE